MQLVVPAILPKSFEELAATVDKVRPYTKAVQFDVCDGNFVDSITWPHTDERPTVAEMLRRGEMLPYADELRYEVDLMVASPERSIDTWIALGATRLIIHFGSTSDLLGLIRGLEERHGYSKGFAPDLLSVGIAVPIGLPLTEFAPYFDKVDFVQCMGIVNIGRQAQAFDTRVVEKARQIHKRYPEVSIQVDGGVTLENTPALLDAGATRLAVGSAILQSDNIAGTIKTFEKLVEQYGIYE